VEEKLSMNVFRRSRRRLTLFYSTIMFVFFAVLICVVHESMQWSLSSEQARELRDTANDVAYAQSFLMQHQLLFDDSAAYTGSRDRLFFYVFDTDGRMLNFSRSSFQIEPFILDTIEAWNVAAGDVAVFSKKDDNGKTTKVMLTAHPIVVNGELSGMVYVGKDVTAIYNGLKKSTYALLLLAFIALAIATVVGHVMSGKAIVPLREAYEKQRQFAADASHELRTPLSVVMASADLLDNDPSITSPFLKQVIADVRDEVKKMTKLVSDLLTVARSDNQALKVKLQKFDISALMEQTLRLMQPLADKKNVALRGEGMAPVEIQADEQKIRQLVLILVDNAVKYTPDGGQVTLRLETAEGGRVRFSVQDTGIGIAKADQDRIFDRFYRVDKARSRAMGGNGLGLAIAQEIVNLHQGKILVKSEPGQGTQFTVDFKAKTENKKVNLKNG
jgi:K+-sensing histidine kinase KdpD